MRRFAGNCRFVFNRALAIKMPSAGQGKNIPGSLRKQLYRMAARPGNSLACRIARPPDAAGAEEPRNRLD